MDKETENEILVFTEDGMSISQRYDFSKKWYVDRELFDNLQHYENCNELIDSNDIKFKYGLFWYLIHRYFENGSDYHYQDLIVLNDNEIKARLKKTADELLINYLFYPCRNEDFDGLFALIKELKRISNKTSTALIRDIAKEKSFDLIDTISEIMYYILTNPTNYYRKKNLFEIIVHSANRVCRNYIAAGLIPNPYVHPEDVYSLINNYYKSKNEKKITVEW